MTTIQALIVCFLAAAVLTSCDTVQNPSVNPVVDTPFSFDLPPIEGVGNLKISITEAEETFFEADIDGLRQVAMPSANIRSGWSLFPELDLSTGNSLYSNVTLFTTQGNSKWDKVNYLLNVRQDLIKSVPQLTRLEVQAAIWTLSPHLNFDYLNPELKTLIPAMVQSGMPAYDTTLVTEVVDHVEANYRGYDFDEFSVYGVIVRGGSDSYGLMLESSLYKIEMVNLEETAGLSIAWDINDHGQIVGGNKFWDREMGTVDMGNIFARAINNDGTVAGSQGSKLMLWSPSSGLSQYQMPAGNQIEVYDINNRGEIVGEMVSEHMVYEDEYGSYYDYEFYGFVWDNSQNLKEITRNGWSSGINDMGMVVGLDYTIPNRAYKWDEQRGLRGLGTYSGYSSGRPNAVNNSGDVVGSILVSSQAAAMESGELQGIRQIKSADRLLRATGMQGSYHPAHVAEMLIQGSFSSVASSVGKPDASHSEQTISQNDLYANASSQSEAFLWNEEGGITRIGTLGGDWSTAWDINDYGQIVGYSSVSAGISKAFIWTEEFGMKELPDFGGNSLARSMNDDGEVIGYSYDESGSFVPVKWTVVWNGF
ncbi:MAG: hypothetical protein R3283_08085 [Balneolaceae bacterium]|nr:hypothetical protein [Balneolaceae bacterium]